MSSCVLSVAEVLVGACIVACLRLLYVPLDKLLTKPVNSMATELPSPQQLMNKIILKHKKLGENLIGQQIGIDVADSG